MNGGDREEESGADQREDPFEHLDDGREGDPFAHLDAPGTADEETDPADAPDPFDAGASDGDDRHGPVDARRDSDDSAGPERVDPAGDPTATDPFGEFEARDGDPFEAAGGAFERVDVGDVDPDEVWDSIAGDGDAAAEASTADDGAATGSRYTDVSKHEFCERCEHFSAPPAVDCAHGDAEIVEFLDSETVRLLNCPVVAERRRIENEE